MSKIQSVSTRRAVAKSDHAKTEFGPGKKGLLICIKCEAYYFKKSWHHGARAFLAKKENRNILTKKVLCPADQMIQNGLWEGEVIIEGLPVKDKKELLNLIRNFCQRAFERDPLDRLISLKEDQGGMVIRMTENQLAQKLGQKIKEVFKKVALKIWHAKDPNDLTVVRIKFI